MPGGSHPNVYLSLPKRQDILFQSPVACQDNLTSSS